MNLMKQLGITKKLSHIMVQTNYCNSQSTRYLNSKGVKTIMAKTGVKYAHPIVASVDLGGNCESNGHGCVTFKKDKVYAAIGKNNSIHAQKLKALLEISNIACGDAIGNLLMQECILYDNDMSIKQFNNIYIENPAIQLKVRGIDRTKTVFKTTSDETKLIEPIEI